MFLPQYLLLLGESVQIKSNWCFPFELLLCEVRECEDTSTGFMTHHHLFMGSLCIGVRMLKSYRTWWGLSIYNPSWLSETLSSHCCMGDADPQCLKKNLSTGLNQVIVSSQTPVTFVGEEAGCFCMGWLLGCSRPCRTKKTHLFFFHFQLL